LRLLVTPIYGYGWSDGNQTIDTPQPFELQVKTTTPGSPFKVALGKLETANHSLSGKWILLSPRRRPYDGDCNLFAFCDEPDIEKPLTAKPAISGFASIQNLG
jgi:hypothetical protein